MTLMPKKTRFRKVQRGTMAGRPRGRAGEVVFGEFGVQALEPVWFTAQQIEASRIAMARKMKKVAGSLILRVFPDKAVTKKPAETRMGKGKGNPELWVAVVKRGCIVFEMGGVGESLAREMFEAARYKLPMKVRLVKKESEKKV
jgi:large subunit ribosomal protein L16